MAIESLVSQLHVLLEQSIAGIYVLAEDGCILYVNDRFARVGGYTPDELVGHDFLAYVAPADLLRAIEQLRQAFDARQRPTIIGVVTKAGEVLHLLTHAAPAQYNDRRAVLGLAVDVTQRSIADGGVAGLNRALRIMRAGNVALVRSHDEHGLIRDMCSALVTEGGFLAASVSLADGSGVTTLAHAAGTKACDEHDVQGHHAAIATGRHQEYPVITAESPGVERVYLPLFHDSVAGAFGSLGVHAGDGAVFTSDDLAMLQELSIDLAYGIVAVRHRAERDTFNERLHRSLEETIGVLAAAAEMRDPYTAGHQERVARLSVAIAREVGLDESRLRALRFAALVHDVGKIRIPTDILTRPGKLTRVERELVETHVQAGYDLLSTVDFPWPIADFVLQHHEHLDGSGYPNHVTGDAIHLESRILCVADTVEAMSANRPYRSGKGVEAALAEVLDGRGVRYDARVVDACIQLVRSGAFSFDDDRPL